MCPSSSHLHPNPIGDIPCVPSSSPCTLTHLPCDFPICPSSSCVSQLIPTHLPSSPHASQLIPPPRLLGHPIPGPPTNPFEVTLEGTSSEVGYGGTVLLNCSSSCPEARAAGGLETSLSKEWVSRGPGWLSVRLRNITEPVSNIFCYFSCSGERKMVTFRVLAYGKRLLGSFPWGFPSRWGMREGSRDALDLGSPHPSGVSGMGQTGMELGPQLVLGVWGEVLG